MLSTLYQLSYLTLRITQWGRHYYLHFTDEELRLIEIKDLPQGTQLVGSRQGIGTRSAVYCCAGGAPLSNGHKDVIRTIRCPV